MQKDPHREELSQRMKYANATRVNKGRIGPRGEDEIREDLQRKLGREPYPDELQFEMHRMKGYEGISRRRRKKVSPSPSTSSEEEEVELKVKRTSDAEGVEAGQIPIEEVGHTSEVQVSLLERMKKELDEHRAEMRAVKKSAVPNLIEDGGPSTSLEIAGLESNATAHAGSQQAVIPLIY